MTLVIRPIEFSETLLAPIVQEAPREGGRFILRLRDEWLDGSQRFAHPGEILLGAFVDDGIAGVGGLSHDPYAPSPGLGRVRHLYVLTAYRRRGIGRALLDRLLQHAQAHFAVVRLSTEAPDAARMYESRGFSRSHGERETHRLEL